MRLKRLQSWKVTTIFGADSDWIFASPLKLGRQPYSYTGVYANCRKLLRLPESVNSALMHSGTRTDHGWML